LLITASPNSLPKQLFHFFIYDTVRLKGSDFDNLSKDS
jgi:hypothetical protein